MANTTFLELTNKVLRRINEVEMQDTDFAAARGIHALAKDAVNASIQFINSEEFYWPFNSATISVPLVSGQQTYNFDANVQIVNFNSFFILPDTGLGTNSRKLSYIGREVWEERLKEKDYDNGADGYDQPIYVFKGIGMDFAVSPIPDKAYTLEYDAYLHPVELTLFSDTSTIPPTYNEAIIQGALYHIYMWRDGLERAQASEKRFKTHVDKMRTILINKDDRIYGTFINRGTASGRSSIPSSGAPF